jgi:branched-chain amino acid transport system permease protein
VGRTQPPGFLDGILNLDEWLYFLALFTAVLMLLLAWGILRGPLGRAFMAVRDSEVAAAAMGINVARTKVTAFTISAFYAGVAGALFTQVNGTITPESISIIESINFLVAIVIGGLASMMGSVIGAAAIIFLPTEGPELVGQIPGLQTDIVERAPGAIQGFLVILVMLLMPRGLAGFAHRLAALRPAAVVEGLRAAPARLRSRIEGARGGLASAWDTRPWNRQNPSKPDRPDGGEGG